MKNKILIGVLAFAFVFTMFGASYAATEWSDDNTFTGIVNWFPNGVKIGQQGTGGVTFFNGTIVNETTTDEGADIPVTFGDNVRIDGELWRGENSGPGDNMPVKINDDLQLFGSVEGLDVADVSDLQTELDNRLLLTGGAITGDLSISGDVTQDISDGGILKAALFYNPIANTASPTFNLSVTPTYNGVGDYTFVFSESIHGKYFVITPSAQNNANCVGHVDLGADASGKTFDVNCFLANSGAAANAYLNLMFF